jgi:hypothetical protein
MSSSLRRSQGVATADRLPLFPMIQIFLFTKFTDEFTEKVSSTELTSESVFL